jgi:hypothetical protein
MGVVCAWFSRLYGSFAVVHLVLTCFAVESKHLFSIRNMCFGNFLEMLMEQCFCVKYFFVLRCFTVSLRSLVKETTRALAGNSWIPHDGTSVHMVQYKSEVSRKKKLWCSTGTLEPCISDWTFSCFHE